MFFLQACSKNRKQFILYFSVNQKGLTGVAYTYPLGFGVDDDIDSHRQVCGSIHKGMAVAGTGFDDRDRTVFHNGTNQSGTASRNQDIHILIQFHECGSGLSGGIFDEKQSVRIDAGICKSLADAGYDCLNGMKRIASAF